MNGGELSDPFHGLAEDARWVGKPPKKRLAAYNDKLRLDSDGRFKPYKKSVDSNHVSKAHARRSRATNGKRLRRCRTLSNSPGLIAWIHSPILLKYEHAHR
jgi:hypothetical protein